LLLLNEYLIKRFAVVRGKCKNWKMQEMTAFHSNSRNYAEIISTLLEIIKNMISVMQFIENIVYKQYVTNFFVKQLLKLFNIV